MSVTRPTLTIDDAKQLLSTHWGLHEVTLIPLDSYDDQNWRVDAVGHPRAVLKVCFKRFPEPLLTDTS